MKSCPQVLVNFLCYILELWPPPPQIKMIPQYLNVKSPNLQIIVIVKYNGFYKGFLSCFWNQISIPKNYDVYKWNHSHVRELWVVKILKNLMSLNSVLDWIYSNLKYWLCSASNIMVDKLVNFMERYWIA